MKNIILTLLLAIVSVVAFSQKGAYNLKKGFVAEGYDVVSYFDQKPVKGSNKFVANHDGVKFRFANQQNLEKFEANPNQYVPEYGGWCAYAVAENNSKVSINPETYEIRDGKLYLFYNTVFANTLDSWLKEGPEDLRKKADENWKTLK